MEWINSKDDSQRVFKSPKSFSRGGRSCKVNGYEVISCPGEGWLCAGALLGLKRLSALMERRMLPLAYAEMMLRSIVHPRALPDGAGVKDGKNFNTYWAEDEIITELVPLFRDLGRAAWGWENLIQEEDRIDQLREKKRGPSLRSKEYRSLKSWLLDESGEKGEKLRVALNKSTHDERSKRLRQLKRDSALIIKALEMLERDPLRIRRTALGKSEALELAKLSLRQQDRQDEMETLLQELERWSEAEAEAKERVSEIKTELERITGTGGKTGSRKRK